MPFAAVATAMAMATIAGCAAGNAPPSRATAGLSRQEGPLDPESIRATIRRVADWQLANPVSFGPRNWAMAPLYDGLISASETTGDPKYLAAVIRAGLRILWEPGPLVYHADDVADGQAWLRIYSMDPTNPAILAPLKERFDQILAKPIRESLAFGQLPHTPGVEATDRWTWSDALYMAPPALVRLTQVTGDERYLAFVDSEFKAAYDA